MPTVAKNIELKNVDIFSKHFGDQPDSKNSMYFGNFFAIAVDNETGEKLKSTGCKVTNSKTNPDVSLVMVRIPKWTKYTNTSIFTVKVKGEVDFFLDYTTMGLLDYADIKKANIKVNIFIPDSFPDRAILYLSHMDVWISKNIKITSRNLLSLLNANSKSSAKELGSQIKEIIDKF